VKGEQVPFLDLSEKESIWRKLQRLVRFSQGG
jgi:hypothetical protein